MALTVAELLRQLEEQQRAGNGARYVKIVRSCPSCRVQLACEIDTVEPGDERFPDEVWIG